MPSADTMSATTTPSSTVYKARPVREKLDWTKHREEIERLYIQDEWTLKAIMDHMRLHRNFHASKPTYERRLREWRIGKNIVGWGAIAEASEQRRLRGKESKIIVRNKTISEDRVKKAMRRHLTTTKAINLKYAKSPAPPKLSNSIVLRSPSPALPSNPVYDAWIDGSPWFRFWRSATSLGIQAVGLGANPATIFGSNTMTKATAVTLPTTTLMPMTALDTLFGRDVLNNRQEAERPPSIATRLRNLIPEEYDGQHLQTAKVLCDRSMAWHTEEIMIQLFFLANNFILEDEDRIDYPGHDKRIVNLLHRLKQNGLQHLKGLLSIQNPTAEAIKEQIFTSILGAGDLELLQFILATDVNLDVVIRGGENTLISGPHTPLSLAADIEDEKKSLDFVSQLIDAGADVNYRGRSIERSYHSVEVDSVSPLHFAVRRGNMAVINKLIANGALVDNLAMEVAIGEKYDEVVQIILDAGLDIYRHGPPLLSLAVQGRNMAIINKLIAKGALVSDYLLEPAIQTKDDEVVQRILEAGADVNADLRGKTPIGLVAQHGHTSMAKILIRLGAATNVDQKMTCIISSGCYSRNYSYAHVTPTAPLGVAISRGHLEMADLFLEQLNRETEQLSTSQYAWSLLIACDRGHDDLALRLLNAGADVHIADSRGMTSGCQQTTLLSSMIRRSRGKINMNLWEALISKGARLNGTLVEAARLNNYGLVKFLLNHNAPWKTFDSGLEPTALGWAVKNGAVKIAQDLYDFGLVDTGTPTSIGNAEMVQFLDRTKLLSGILHANGSAILHRAIREGCESLIWELMAHDDDIDFIQEIKNVEGYSEPVQLLDAAIRFGPLELIGHLLDRGAIFGRLTLLNAVQHEQRNEILDVLLPFDHDTWDPDDIEPRDGTADYFPALVEVAGEGISSTLHTLLHRVNWGPERIGESLTAAILFDQIGLVEDLLLAGASLEEGFYYPDCGQQPVISALAAAVETKREELAVKLINAGADVNKPATDYGTRTALQHAAEIGHLKLVDILLEAGAEVNAPPAPDMGATALQFAAIGGYLEIARRLLRAGADIRADGCDMGREESGRTALEGAAEHGRLEMVHLLLEFPATLKGIFTDQYWRSMELAKENGHNAVARLIESVWAAETEQNDSDADDDRFTALDESVSPNDLESGHPNEEQSMPQTIFLPTGTNEFMQSSERQELEGPMEIDEIDAEKRECALFEENDIADEVMNGGNNSELLTGKDNFMFENGTYRESIFEMNEAQSFASHSEWPGFDSLTTTDWEQWIDFGHAA